MKRLLVAIQFLTRLPTPRVVSDGEDFAASMRWFPAVGLIVGVIVAGAAWCGQRLDSGVGALAALAAWVAVTGALHLDGLGDIADAAGAAHGDRTKLRAVLADPHIGSFGVVAIGLQLIAKFALLQSLLAHEPAWMLLPIPFAARIGPLVWARGLPALHAGLGARFARIVRLQDMSGWGAILLGIAVVEPALLATLPLIAAWGWWLRHRIGGISGDGHGAGIEIVESGLLLAIACLG